MQAQTASEAASRKRRRTARSDCSFVIYEWLSPVEGQSYIGLTRRSVRSPLESAWLRYQKHQSRAIHEPWIKWPLYEHLRLMQADSRLAQGWRLVVVEVVRGRAEAYARERVIVKERRPTLNMQYCTDAADTDATEGEEA